MIEKVAEEQSVRAYGFVEGKSTRIGICVENVIREKRTCIAYLVC